MQFLGTLCQKKPKKQNQDHAESRYAEYMLNSMVICTYPFLSRQSGSRN